MLKKRTFDFVGKKKRTLAFVGSARSFINSEPVFIEILFFLAFHQCKMIRYIIVFCYKFSL